jgi:RimJ/RimL family protein N-acetyltransferase
VRIRRAEPADVDFVVALLGHDEVEPFLSARRAREPAEVLERIERSQREQDSFGVFVIEEDGERAGTMEFETANERSRIAYLGGLALDPEFRGRGLADEAARAFQRHLLLDLGFHRLQLEIYAFNERAIAHAERVGFAHEGTRRKAYRRHGGWVDSVMYGLVREDLGLPPTVDLLYEYVGRHNLAVRTGDRDGVDELFSEDAVLELERPLDEEIRVVDVEEHGAAVLAGYAWAREPDVEAGRIVLTPADGLIARLELTG